MSQDNGPKPEDIRVNQDFAGAVNQTAQPTADLTSLDKISTPSPVDPKIEEMFQAFGAVLYPRGLGPST